MKYEGTLTVTPFQVGDTVFILENDVPVETVVVETENHVYLNDAEAEVEEIRYKLAGYELKQFPASEVFASAAALKTDFESMVDGL